MIGCNTVLYMHMSMCLELDMHVEEGIFVIMVLASSRSGHPESMSSSWSILKSPTAMKGKLISFRSKSICPKSCVFLSLTPSPTYEVQ